MKAELQSVHDGKVRFLRSDNGQRVVVPLNRLCDADRDFLSGLEKPNTSNVDTAAIPVNGAGDAKPQSLTSQNSDGSGNGSGRSVQQRRLRSSGNNVSHSKRQDQESATQEQTDSSDQSIRPGSPVFEDDLPVIDSSLLEVETVNTGGSWDAMSDQELVSRIHLSGEVVWKGQVQLSHSLEPMPPNFEFVIAVAEADFLDCVTNVGYVKFEKMEDNTAQMYSPLVLPPGVADSSRGWTLATRALKGKVGVNRSADETDSAALRIAVEFPRPRPVPQSIRSAKGQFKLLLCPERKILTVRNVSEKGGRIVHPLLTEKGIDIAVRQPDEVTLVVEIRGNVNSIAGLKLLCDDQGQPIGETQMNASRATYYQYNFVDGIPDNPGLSIELVSRSRELVVPFDFKEVPVQTEDPGGRR